MQNFPKIQGSRQSLLMALGTLIGIGIGLTLGIVTQLPLAHATVLTALGMSGLIVACAYISRPVYWWMAVGAIAGMIIGLGGILAGYMAAEKETVSLNVRLTFVAFQSTAGFIAGVLVGRKTPQAHLPTLKEFISSLSAITAGLYALIVTGRFLWEGLDPARTLSSRLSTSTTILITLLAIPGALGYLLGQHFPPTRRRLR